GRGGRGRGRGSRRGRSLLGGGGGAIRALVQDRVGEVADGEVRKIGRRRLGRGDGQPSAGGEGAAEPGGRTGPRFGSEVHEHVAAQQEVDHLLGRGSARVGLGGRGTVTHQVVGGEADAPAQLVADLPAVGRGGEPPAADPLR